ncbi:hypothetical protein ACFVTY_05395 [Streptomyces sp. NPDC058067]|uniref:hypothetical protein n=1 Tax=Streptomyces sp. NPDC058067 TaxID=3346324 RepID=UPI0036EB5626
MKADVIAGLRTSEPALEPDIVFGAQATVLLEEHLRRQFLGTWRDERSALPSPTQEA